jgi:Domain of unknown function (DUF1905)
MSAMQLSFTTKVITWRGPAPFFYAPLPAEEAEAVRLVASAVTYGWGVIPVRATLNGLTFTTSLFPKDGTYLVPLKAAVRKPFDIGDGDTISLELVLEA